MNERIAWTLIYDLRIRKFLPPTNPIDSPIDKLANDGFFTNIRNLILDEKAWCPLRIVCSAECNSTTGRPTRFNNIRIYQVHKDDANDNETLLRHIITDINVYDNINLGIRMISMSEEGFKNYMLGLLDPEPENGNPDVYVENTYVYDTVYIGDPYTIIVEHGYGFPGTDEVLIQDSEEDEGFCVALYCDRTISYNDDIVHKIYQLDK